jgi:hypothetical protein
LVSLLRCNQVRGISAELAERIKERIGAGLIKTE